MSSENILVLGSKPNSVIPKIKIKKIYTANGAAERAISYKKKNPNIQISCVTGALSFNRDFRVRNRIVKCNPNRIIIRCGNILLPNKLKKNCKIKYFNHQNQWNFQKNFFKYGCLTLLIGEFFYNVNFLKKIRYFFSSLKKDSFQGISTGFFAILLALKENPKCNIIVSGIGMSGGGHFYKNSRNKKFNYNARAGVDRYLIKKIDKELKKRIFSVDLDFVKLGEVNQFREKII